MKIAVLDDYQGAFRNLACAARLKDHEVAVYRDTEKDPVRLALRLADAEVVVLRQQRTELPRSVIERLPALKLVVQIFNNTDHVDVAACTERGIVVSHAGRADGTSTAELTWGLIIASLRHLPYEAEQLRRGSWQTTLGTALQGKTLGVYALGHIGSLVAKVGVAFGMRVTCWGRSASHAKACAAGYEVAASRPAFFESADIVSLHIRLTGETRGIITAADLELMKPTALIVNTSRAALFEDHALVDALKRGRPGYAAVDVFEDEPVLNGDHPLLGMPNVVCTPHIGGIVGDVFEYHYGIAIDCILGFFEGNPLNVINPPALAMRRSH